ncbi:hypothetical protein ACFQX7_04110 [Luedemannella flava]
MSDLDELIAQQDGALSVRQALRFLTYGAIRAHLRARRWRARTGAC